MRCAPLKSGRAARGREYLLLVTWAAHAAAGFPHEEVEIDALVGLLHRRAIELHPAAVGVRLRRLPLGAALGKLLVGHVEMQPSLADVELDDVAVPHQRE